MFFNHSLFDEDNVVDIMMSSSSTHGVERVKSPERDCMKKCTKSSGILRDC